MGLALCWYDPHVFILSTGLIPVQPAVQHTISQRSQSMKTAQFDSRTSNDEDECKNRSSIPRGPTLLRRQMEDLQEQIALDLRVKRQRWIQPQHDMRHIPRGRGYGRRASTRRVNRLGPRRGTGLVKRPVPRAKITI